ncbi:MAG: hypothetical protein J1E39_07425 [Eubacterium sp.]|nr:hypothetical protein [Eubacterium sp.]
MTTEKKSFFAAYFFYKLKQFKVQTTFSVIISLLGLPLMTCVIMLMVHATRYKWGKLTLRMMSDFSPILMILVLICITVMVFFFAIMPAKAYSYYNKRENVELYGTLALSFRQRFWADFFAGLTAVLGPVLVSMIPTVIFLVMSDSMARDVINGIREEGNWVLLPLIESGMLMPYLWKTVAAVIIGYIAVYVIGVFINACGGRQGVSAAYTFLAALIIPVAASLLFVTIYNGCIGIDVWESITGVVALFPPFGSVLAALISVDAVMSPLTFIGIVLIYGGMLTAAYFLAKYRKTERTGNAFVYRGAYHVISVMFVVCVLCLAFANMDKGLFGMSGGIVILMAVLLSLIGLILAEHSFYRSGARLWRAAVKYVSCAAGAAVLFFGLSATRGFGAESFVPDVGEIESVSVTAADYREGIEISYYDEFMGDDYYEKWDNEFRFIVTYTEQEDVEFITGQHKALLDGGAQSGDNIKLTYKLKNGSEIYRSYSVASDDHGFVQTLATYGGTKAELTRQFELGMEGSVNAAVPQYGWLGGIDGEDADRLLAALQNDARKHTDGENIGVIEMYCFNNEVYMQNFGLANIFKDYYNIYNINSENRLSAYVTVKDSYTETLAVMKAIADKNKAEENAFRFGGPYLSINLLRTEDTNGTVGINRYILYAYTDGAVHTDKVYDELLSLIKVCPDGTDAYDSFNKDTAGQLAFDMLGFVCGRWFYIPEEDVPRACELIDEYEKLEQERYETVYSGDDWETDDIQE